MDSTPNIAGVPGGDATGEVRSSRYRSLDLWRGLICLFVVIEHAAVALWPGMEDGDGLEGRLRLALVAPFLRNVGTPMFFVISGFCIASSLESHRRRGGDALAFLGRRLWRVFPPYWCALLGFVAIIAGLDALGLGRWHRSGYALELPSVGELNGPQWLGNITLTETWRPRVGGGEANVFTRVAWSLCYQEQFYVVCGLVLLVARGSLFRVLAIASVAIVAARVVAEDVGMGHRIAGTFPTLWHEFAIGLAVFLRLNRCDGRPFRFAVDGALVFMMLLGFGMGYDTLLAASAFGLGLIVLRRHDDTLARIAKLNPLRAMGRCSYGIYLCHLPIVMLVAAALADSGVTAFWARAAITVPLAVAASTAVGMLFSRHVESRFVELPSWRPSRPGFLSATTPGTVRIGSAG